MLSRNPSSATRYGIPSKLFYFQLLWSGEGDIVVAWVDTRLLWLIWVCWPVGFLHWQLPISCCLSLFSRRLRASSQQQWACCTAQARPGFAGADILGANFKLPTLRWDTSKSVLPGSFEGHQEDWAHLPTAVMYPLLSCLPFVSHTHYILVHSLFIHMLTF